jgi:TPR repeat protein
MSACHFLLDMKSQAPAEFPSSAKILALKEKADQNDANAEYEYGCFLESGCGVAVDLTEAARYYKLAADQQHVRAVYKYGFCLENGP